MNDTRQFLCDIYEQNNGYTQLTFIDGDPAIEKLQEDAWYQWPKQVNDILDRIVYLSNRYGNVYISSCLHQSKNCNYKTAKDSRILWVDDIQPCEDFSIVIQTSESSYHGYYLLDRRASAHERSALQRALKVKYSADDCSSDAVHVVRVPGTFNTKRHGRFAVRLERRTATIYSVDDLQATLKVTSYQTEKHTPLDTALVETKLGNIARIEARIKKSLKPNNVAYQTLIDAKNGAITNWSEARFRIIRGLVGIGIPDDEIAACIWHWCDHSILSWGHLDQKAQHFKVVDIERCIAKALLDIDARGITLRREATYGATEKPAQPMRGTPARKDRPQRLTPDVYLTWLQEQAIGDTVMLSVAECAAAHHVDRQVIQRIEKKLRSANKIGERVTNRHSVTMKITRGIIFPADITNTENTETRGIIFPAQDELRGIIFPAVIPLKT